MKTTVLFLFSIILILVSGCSLTDNMAKYNKMAEAREYSAWKSSEKQVRLQNARDAAKQSNRIASDQQANIRLNNKIERILSKTKD